LKSYSLSVSGLLSNGHWGAVHFGYVRDAKNGLVWNSGATGGYQVSAFSNQLSARSGRAAKAVNCAIDD